MEVMCGEDSPAQNRKHSVRQRKALLQGKKIVMPDNLSDERRPKRTPPKKTPKVLACQNVTCQQQGG